MRKPAKSAPLSSAKPPITDPEPARDRHGFRGVPPPSTIDLDQLPDSASLTDFEICSILRVSTNTTGQWRQQPDHPLKWFTLPNGFVRYQVSAIRAFLAMGRSRARKPRADRAVVHAPRRPATASRRRRAPKSDPRSNVGVNPT